MDIKEKLKREYFLEGLEDLIDLDHIIGSCSSKSKQLSSSEIKKEAEDFVKYMLQNDLFAIHKFLDKKFVLYDSFQKNIEQIKKILNELNGNVFGIIWFNLTDKGIHEAKKYLKKTVDLQIRILKSARNQFLSFNELINFTKEEFNTEDNEEIEYEILEIIPYLEDHDMIRKFLQFNNQLINWEINSTGFREKIKNEFNKYKEVLFFKNTKKGNEILEKYEKFGGDIHEYSWQYTKENKKL